MAADRSFLRCLLITIAFLPAMLIPPGGQSATVPPPARATLASATESLGNRVLDEAETRTGDWYVYGTAGPSTFDCSGLVMWAAAQIGLGLPHSTFSMLISGHLHPIPVSSAQRGDLMFFGPGHVEIDTIWPHTTFGAQNTGTKVGWHVWNNYWQPTMAFRLR